MSRSGSKRPARIVWSERALSDLHEIDEYIAADNPIAAERWVATLIAATERAAAAPLAGRIVPERRIPMLREVFVRAYRVVYRVREGVVEIVTIFEGHRLLPRDVNDANK